MSKRDGAYKAYKVVESEHTYGPATPYAVVSTASGMPHLPAHDSKQEAQREADRLNATMQREAERRRMVAQRKAERLNAAARTSDNEGDGATP